MKITFVLSTLWLSGGVRDVVEIANRLVDRGYDITFVTSGGTVDPDVRREIRPEIRILESGFRVSDARLNLWQKLRLSWSLFRRIPRSSVIISTQTPTTVPTLLGKLRYRAKLAWFYQDYREMFLDRPVEEWLVRHAFRWHDAAFVLSTHSREELISYHPGEVTVVRVGLSHAESFRPLPAGERMRQAGEQPQKPGEGLLPAGVRRNILFLGDMRPRKGLPDFLAAMDIVVKEAPDIHLWIVSKDDCEIESGVPFEYIYRPSRQALAGLFARCDVFVSASWWESFGIPPLEAMACGAPVVMTDSRGGREYARHRVNCLLVPPKNPGELARAVLEVLRDPALEEQLRAQGPLTAAEFTWEETATRFENGLKKLTAPEQR